MPKENKATEIEKETRVLAVAKAILSGYTKRSFLLQYVSDKYNNWGVNERQIDNYIRDAKEIIRNKYSEEDLEIEKDIALSRLETLFSMNFKIQDYRECRSVTMDRMKLLGLLVDKKEVDQKTKHDIIWSEEKTYETDNKANKGD